jgi:hypothetical protein
MKKIIFLLIIPVMMLVVGCVKPQNRPAYIWQNYSASLYTLKKSPSDANLKNHKDVLLSIIDESKKENCRVPPGVYCEYGYLLLKEGNKEEAFRYFDLEETTYPESTVFIQNLKIYITKTSKQFDDSKAENSTGNVTIGSGGDKDLNNDSK